MARKRKVRWSYSQLAVYERCPLAWKFAYLDRLPRRPAGPAADRGTAIHLELENFLNRPRAKKVPASLEVLTKVILTAKALGAVGEREVFFDRNWNEVRKEDDPWGVAKIDAHWLEQVTLHVRDLKSGRARPYDDQVRIYLAILIGLYPDAQYGYGGIWYCDQPAAAAGRPIQLNRQQLLGIRKELEARVGWLETDTKLAATPSESACRYCDFSRRFGGPCTRG